MLKPQAGIWASTPLFYHEHETPYDFYRYTQFALRRMFAEAHFASIELDWLEGYWQTVGYQLDMMSWAVPNRMMPIKVMLKIASNLCARRDLTHKRTDVGLRRTTPLRRLRPDETAPGNRAVGVKSLLGRPRCRPCVW